MYDMIPSTHSGAIDRAVLWAKDTHVYEFVSSHMYDMRSKKPHMHDMIPLTHMLLWWRGRKDHMLMR